MVCHHSFIRKKQSIGFSDFLAFYRFILGKKNRSQLIEEKAVCRKTLSSVFITFFNKPLPPDAVNKIFPLSFSRFWVLSLDGTWLRRFGVIMIYWNQTDGKCLWWSWEKSESYLALGSGLQAVTSQTGIDHLPKGVVSDWKGSIVYGVATYLGSIPHQRCLAHVKRDIEHLLPRHSPYQATQELRRIGLQLLQVKTINDKETWLTLLSTWEVFYGAVLTERSISDQPTKTKRKWWYTHSNIRRAYRILTKDQDHLFEYLTHPQIPSTNNTLEGINSDIKCKLRNHRGMKAEQQYQFVSWYLSLKKVKTKADLKKLWAYWRSL